MTATELIKLRKSTGLSQQNFGVKVLGITGDTVGHWERREFQIGPLVAIGVKVKVEDYLAEQKKAE